uniref:Uncharacterized protein n=1 Tax=Rhizophora mucronata TaxID=61149 RepID=A0A2P2QN58_RHIMU
MVLINIFNDTKTCIAVVGLL